MFIIEIIRLEDVDVWYNDIIGWWWEVEDNKKSILWA
jgi:hypothetical protein